jgi:hypothetical protein
VAPLASASAPAAAVEPEVVQEPEAVVLVGRVASITIAQLVSSQSTFAPLRDPVQLLAPFLPPSLDALVHPAAPLELAVAMPSLFALARHGPHWAVSIPLTSYDAAAAALTAEGPDYELRVVRRGGMVEATSYDATRGEHCWLMPSWGSSPARLVVGAREESLHVLGAYLARGLPLRELGPEPVVVEFFPRKFLEHGGAALRTLAPSVLSGFRGARGAESLLAAMSGASADLLQDLGQVRLTARPDGGGMVMSASAELTGRSSWLARSVVSAGSRGDSARAMFSRLPADTELAGFSQGPEPARVEEARAVLASWLSERFGAGTQAATLQLVARTFVPRAPCVYGQGDASGVDAPRFEYSGYGLWASTLSTFGWHIIGFDEPAAQLQPALDAGMNAYNSGDLRSLAYRELLTLCPGLGKIVKRPPPAGLPKASALYELKMPTAFFKACMGRHQTMLDPAPDESLVVVMVPDGSRTWIGFGPQGSPSRRRVVTAADGTTRVEFGPPESRMVAKMADLLRAGGSRLDTLPGLDPLRTGSPAAGGFLTIAGLGGLVRFVTMREYTRWERVQVDALPGRGRTPVPFWLQVDTGNPPRVTATVQLRSDALAGLAQVFSDVP